MTRLHILSLYGVGKKYSRGLDVLAQKICTAWGADDCTVYPAVHWNNNAEIERHISDTIPRADRIVLIGHSGGANETTIVARNLPAIDIDLLVAIHMSRWMSNRVPVGNNVHHVVEVYGRNFFNLFGTPILKLAPDFLGLRENIHSKVSHTAIDDNAGIHARIIERVQGLATKGTAYV